MTQENYKCGACPASMGDGYGEVTAPIAPPVEVLDTGIGQAAGYEDDAAYIAVLRQILKDAGEAFLDQEESWRRSL